MIKAYAIRDSYWFPNGDIDVNPRQGAPSGYTFTDPALCSQTMTNGCAAARPHFGS